MCKIKDISDGELEQLYGRARGGFAAAGDQKNPEGVAILTEHGTILWGSSNNPDGLSAGEDALRHGATLQEPFTLAVITTHYDPERSVNAPVAGGTLKALKEFGGSDRILVKVIPPEHGATRAFFLS